MKNCVYEQISKQEQKSIKKRNTPNCPVCGCGLLETGDCTNILGGCYYPNDEGNEK